MTLTWQSGPQRVGPRGLGLWVFLVGCGGAAILLASVNSNTSFYLDAGVLASSTDEYLDGTGHVFQRGSWHLGNALRTRGLTYGIKLNRHYLTFCVKHINPRVSPKEANESD